MTLDLSEIRQRNKNLRNACQDNTLDRNQLILMALACAEDVQPLLAALAAAERLAEHRQRRIHAALKLIDQPGDLTPGRLGVLRQHLVTVLESSTDTTTVTT